jgi:hypothetical protein
VKIVLRSEENSAERLHARMRLREMLGKAIDALGR